MKVIVSISRVLVGCLFIFSGLVKAIDPKGLSYKMQEFFEVWAADGFLPKLSFLSLSLVSLEVILPKFILFPNLKRLFFLRISLWVSVLV